VAVRSGACRLGVPAEHVLAMDPVVEGGVVRARLAAPPVYGAGKMTAIARARPDAVLLGAFGDSVYDVAMLRAARVPVAVDPKASLLAAIAAGDVRGHDGGPFQPLVLEP
jgi:phosphatidylglycerophosphatase C